MRGDFREPRVTRLAQQDSGASIAELLDQFMCRETHIERQGGPTGQREGSEPADEPRITGQEQRDRRISGLHGGNDVRSASPRPIGQVREGPGRIPGLDRRRVGRHSSTRQERKAEAHGAIPSPAAAATATRPP